MQKWGGRVTWPFVRPSVAWRNMNRLSSRPLFFQSPSDEENVPRSASEVQDDMWHEISLIKNSKTLELFKAKNINICSFYPRNFDLSGPQDISGPSAHFSTTLPSFFGNLKEIKCEENTLFSLNESQKKGWVQEFGSLVPECGDSGAVAAGRKWPHRWLDTWMSL